ncbi:MAG: biotin/lipoyl-binding protein [Syntrophobacterales bacterium]|nr:biotin/lipoyl-binding protein [Syntrophobacterales bacterium]
MRPRLMVGIAILGIIGSVISAKVYSKRVIPQEPLKAATNPYENGIYSTGIVESHQSHGANITIVPEVSGIVVRIFVEEGQRVNRGDPLIAIDDTIQRQTVEQLRAQSDAAMRALQRARAAPRKEELEVVQAQMDYAKVALDDKRAQFEKIQRAYQLNPKSISRDDFDKAKNAYEIAQRSYDIAVRQYRLTKAGTWEYDIKTLEAQYLAANKAYEAAAKLLEKYVVRAPSDGIVARIQASLGSYVSPQGSYDLYTGSYGPVIIMMNSSIEQLQVRCYVDELLVPKLPHPDQITATMYIRGSDRRVPLEYVRLEPYIIPKIQLSNGRRERVDVRVLPVIFRFQKPEGVNIFPGQLVDVYIGEKQ